VADARRGLRSRTAAGALVLALACLLLAGFRGAGPGPASAADGQHRRSGAKPAPPELSAPAAILIDARDGRVLYRRAAREPRQIASTTKLMTALLAVELLPLDRTVRAGTYRAGAAESRINLRPGERMKVADLLRALMLPSANDAAVALARAAGGSVGGFVDLMNARARQLGLKDTHYTTPVGLDDRANHSSARDLVRLARRVLRNRFLAETVDMPQARLSSGSHQRIVVNRNDLVKEFPWVNGVKTGHTAQAGFVLVGAAQRKRVPLISAVLGTSSQAARDTDTVRLFNYGYSLYRRVTVLRPGRAVARAQVAYYGDREVALRPERRVVLTLRRGERPRTVVDAPAELDGPLEAGSRVGTVSVTYRGRPVSRIPLVTGSDVPGAGPLRKLGSWVLKPWLVLPVALLAGGWVYRRQRRMAASDAARRRRRRAAGLD
jgi:D-alanyl-D-alanine carboxypeptidase (penicillin-binding protein 5/6)